MAAIKHQGLTDGVTSEWTLFAKIKPGHGEKLREYAKARRARFSGSGEEDVVLGVGTVHDYRWVIFDNDTQILFMSNFDGDWSQYIDDFFATKIVEEGFDDVLEHCEDYPERSTPHPAKKAWFLAHTQVGAWYARAYHATTKEIWKALALQKAFQQVLDDPAAAKALTQTPALKPLLDHAAK